MSAGSDSATPASRVLCVALNAALDLTYDVDAVVLGDVNRVTTTHAHAGGKAINVARLLTDAGREALVCGFAGGLVGAEITALLDEAGVAHRMVPSAGPSRRTVTVTTAGCGESTGFYEPGPPITTAEWQAFLAAYRDEVDECVLAVLAGSLPPGVPPDAYRQLTAAARARSVPVIIDAHGKALLHALDAGPSLVKPNEAELADAAGLSRPLSTAAAVDAARRLLEAGAERVVVSLGRRGLIGMAGERAWLVAGPVVEGNPAGAGDAVVAVLAEAQLAGMAWPEALRRAVATAAAAVRTPAAGLVDADHVAEQHPLVEVREL